MRHPSCLGVSPPVHNRFADIREQRCRDVMLSSDGFDEKK